LREPTREVCAVRAFFTPVQDFVGGIIFPVTIKLVVSGAAQNTVVALLAINEVIPETGLDCIVTVVGKNSIIVAIGTAAKTVVNCVALVVDILVIDQFTLTRAPNDAISCCKAGGVGYRGLGDRGNPAIIRNEIDRSIR
jgi:uncharacterized membrane protein YdcZ (DUF606 family)